MSRGESHVWERGDELTVSAGALSRHRAALAMLQRYGPRCSLLLALMLDVIEYYRCWGSRKELVTERWKGGAPVGLPPLLPQQLPTPASAASAAAPAPATLPSACSRPDKPVLLDKLLASLRLWVPLLPLPPGPLRIALLNDLAAYIVAAWDRE